MPQWRAGGGSPGTLGRWGALPDEVVEGAAKRILLKRLLEGVVDLALQFLVLLPQPGVDRVLGNAGEHAQRRVLELSSLQFSTPVGYRGRIGVADFCPRPGDAGGDFEVGVARVGRTELGPRVGLGLEVARDGAGGPEDDRQLP